MVYPPARGAGMVSCFTTGYVSRLLPGGRQPDLTGLTWSRQDPAGYTGQQPAILGGSSFRASRRLFLFGGLAWYNRSVCGL